MLTWDGTETRPTIEDAIWFYRRLQLDCTDPAIAAKYAQDVDELLTRWLAASAASGEGTNDNAGGHAHHGS